MASTKVPIELSSTPGIVDNSNATAITIDSSENVGIGTSSPSSLLHLSSNAPTIQFSETDVGTENYIQASGGGFNFFADDSNAVANTTMGFFVDGSEKMRIDSSGNVGIGTNNPTGNLVVVNSGGGGLNIGYNSTSVNYYDADTQIFRNGSFAEKVRIDSSGRVGIGTTSPSSYYSKSLVVSAANEDGITIVAANGATTYANYLMFADGTTGNEAYRGWLGYDHNSDSFNIASHGFLRIYSGATTQEAMRIDGSGIVLIGTTSTSIGTLGTTNALGVAGNSGSTTPLVVFAETDATVENDSCILELSYSADTSFSAYYALFSDSGGTQGSISGTGAGTVSYNTSSDERIKENIVDTSSQLDKVKQIQVRDFNYIGKDTTTTGMIAQELNTIIPNVVVEGGDDATKHPWGIDYGKLTPYLIKAIQEQQTIIEDLKTRIETLENN